MKRHGVTASDLYKQGYSNTGFHINQCEVWHKEQGGTALILLYNRAEQKVVSVEKVG